MKLLTLSLSTLFSTLAYSSTLTGIEAAAGAGAGATEAPATVYFFTHGSSISYNSNKDHCDVPLLDLKETRATLAHWLNLGPLSKSHEEKDTFVNIHGPIQQVLNNQPGMVRKDMFETIDANLMMVIEGVNDSQDLLPLLDPVFKIDTSEGIQDIITELGNTIPEGNRHLFNTHKSSKSGNALANAHLLEEHHTNIDINVFDLDKRADALFLEESVSLRNYLDQYRTQYGNDNSDFFRVTIKGLAALASEHGVDSVQYKTAQQVLKEFLADTLIPKFGQIHKKFTATIITVAPLAHHEFESSSSFNENPLLKASAPSNRLKKRALPQNGHCFETEADCQTNTNGCNEHGSCVFSIAANCFTCKCSRVNNTQYGGKTCDKIDVSVEFHLFFWLGLGLILTVAVAVGMIVQMGNHSQGGVPVGPTRAQLKRD